MITVPDRRIATLDDARSRRSAEKRTAVEDAVMRLRDSRQAVTFVSVAREAKVSRLCRAVTKPATGTLALC